MTKRTGRLDPQGYTYLCLRHFRCLQKSKLLYFSWISVRHIIIREGKNYLFFRWSAEGAQFIILYFGSIVFYGKMSRWKDQWCLPIDRLLWFFLELIVIDPLFSIEKRAKIIFCILFSLWPLLNRVNVAQPSQNIITHSQRFLLWDFCSPKSVGCSASSNVQRVFPSGKFWHWAFQSNQHS